MNYLKIDECDMLNGDGIRVVLWLTSCPHACRGCHNIQTWDKENGFLFDENTKERLFKLLSDKYIDGLTISGGDPLCDDNYDEVYKLCEDVKSNFPNKNIWVWTGYTVDELDKLNKTSIFKNIDMIIDGKFMAELKNSTIKFRGSSNQKRYSIMNGVLKFID